MDEIKIKVSSNETEWIEHVAKKQNISPEHLVHQLAFSLLNLYINGSIEDQKTVVDTLVKYMDDEHKTQNK